MMRAQEARLIRLEARPPAGGAFPTFAAPPTWREIIEAFKAQERRFPNLHRTISDADLMMLTRAHLAAAKARNPNREPAPAWYADIGDMSEDALARALGELRAEVEAAA